ncbi:hypothetical protein [Lentisalinibacter salinarum]|uniref:hypothetical protein n=1 Tax=Lentisalinibacter salinarum TaxID=2992239 RepID=UPI003866FDA4
MSFWHEIAAQMVEARTWRDAFRYTLATYVSLLAIFADDPDKLGASRLSQMRLLGGDLGLSPSHAHRVERG